MANWFKYQIPFDRSPTVTGQISLTWCYAVCKSVLKHVHTHTHTPSIHKDTDIAHTWPWQAGADINLDRYPKQEAPTSARVASTAIAPESEPHKAALYTRPTHCSSLSVRAISDEEGGGEEGEKRRREDHGKTNTTYIPFEMNQSQHRKWEEGEVMLRLPKVNFS